MMWPGLHLELVEDLRTGRVLQVGVSEAGPSQATQRPGQTSQHVTLLLPVAERLAPPTRLMVRGLVMRVLGTQMPPEPGAGALVLCELINPDLPDRAVIYRPAVTFDRATNKNTVTETVLWAGEAHFASGDPRISDSGGELAPDSTVVVTLPIDVDIDVDDAWIRATTTSEPALRGATLKVAGEIFDSSLPLRRLSCQMRGVL